MIISAAKATEAAEVLGVSLEGLALETVNKAYRNKAKECHPDQHGSAKLKQWASVSWAKECLTGWVTKHPPEPASDVPSVDLRNGPVCGACGGSGRVTVGFNGLTMWCVLCRGQGVIQPEEVDND